MIKERQKTIQVLNMERKIQGLERRNSELSTRIATLIAEFSQTKDLYNELQYDFSILVKHKFHLAIEEKLSPIISKYQHKR